MIPTLVALTGFVSWTLFLLVLMEAIRTKLVATKAVPPNGFTPTTPTCLLSCSGWRERMPIAWKDCRSSAD